MAATLVTTTAFGTGFLFWMRTDALGPDIDTGADLLLAVVKVPWVVWKSAELRRIGLSFSLPLLAILLSHELGHFFACRRHRIPCTPPYFLPAPLLIGTLGAFIRIRSRIRTRSELLDVGAAGPLAGFIVLLPTLIFGLVHSTPARVLEADPEIANAWLLLPGQSLLSRGLIHVIHGAQQPGMVLDLHPAALAGWVGLLVTALNLIPLGQLDGGHILYAVSPRWYRRLRPVILAGLALLGFRWPGWWLWFGILLLVAWRHPPILQPAAPLGRGRRWIALAALLLFLLVFIPVPLDEISILI